jgi:SAM-dependent methyltransferase
MSSALESWRADLASWAIPDHILAAVPDSPWGMPREVFLRRTQRRIAEPVGPTYRLALDALGSGGSVLDVGAGAGAASLPLAAALRHATAVDTDRGLLDAYGSRAARLGVPVDLVPGRWPDVAAQVAPADVAVCAHVLYNVPDLGPFAEALTVHARRRVLVEITERHPLTPLNPLWERFHGLVRPQRPTAQDAVAALRELGLRPAVTRWRRAAEPDYATLDELAEATRRRLCLPASAVGEVREALRETGTAGEASSDPGTSGRSLVTLSWPGTAR